MKPWYVWATLHAVYIFDSALSFLGTSFITRWEAGTFRGVRKFWVIYWVGWGGVVGNEKFLGAGGGGSYIF